MFIACGLLVVRSFLWRYCGGYDYSDDESITSTSECTTASSDDMESRSPTHGQFAKLQPGYSWTIFVDDMDSPRRTSMDSYTSSVIDPCSIDMEEDCNVNRADTRRWSNADLMSGRRWPNNKTTMDERHVSSGKVLPSTLTDMSQKQQQSLQSLLCYKLESRTPDRQLLQLRPSWSCFSTQKMPEFRQTSNIVCIWIALKSLATGCVKCSGLLCY